MSALRVTNVAFECAVCVGTVPSRRRRDRASNEYISVARPGAAAPGCVFVSSAEGPPSVDDTKPTHGAPTSLLRLSVHSDLVVGRQAPRTSPPEMAGDELAIGLVRGAQHLDHRALLDAGLLGAGSAFKSHQLVLHRRPLLARFLRLGTGRDLMFGIKTAGNAQPGRTINVRSCGRVGHAIAVSTLPAIRRAEQPQQGKARQTCANYHLYPRQESPPERPSSESSARSREPGTHLNDSGYSQLVLRERSPEPLGEALDPFSYEPLRFRSF